MSSRSTAGALIGDTVNSKQQLTQIKSNGGLLRRVETRVPGENLSVQRREPTNSTHIWRWIWESNPGHIGGRRVLSPLRQPWTLEVYSKGILSLWRWWPIPFWTLSSPSFAQILTSYLSLPRNSCWYRYFTFQATQSGNMSLVINYKYQKTWHGCEYHIIDAYVYARSFLFLYEQSAVIIIENITFMVSLRSCTLHRQVKLKHYH